MKAKYFNKFGVTQTVIVTKKCEGSYTLCINELGSKFWAVTKGLKNIN